MNIREIVARRRDKLGLGTHVVGLRAGMTHQTVRNFEQGAADLTLMKFVKLVEALGGRLSIQWLGAGRVPVVSPPPPPIKRRIARRPLKPSGIKRSRMRGRKH